MRREYHDPCVVGNGEKPVRRLLQLSILQSCSLDPVRSRTSEVAVENREKKGTGMKDKFWETGEILRN